MGRNIYGVYELPAAYLAETGDTIQPTQHNTPLEDLETDANTVRPVVAGGTGGNSASTARTALGVDAKASYSSKAANYTAVAADNNSTIKFTAAATLSLTAAATLTSGWGCFVIADGGALTIDPAGAELINGAATLALADGESVIITCSGTDFAAAIITPSTYDWAAAVVAAAAKATPIDADSIGLVDSAAANVLKEVTIAQLKAVFLAGTPTLSTIEGLSLVAGDTLYATAADTLERLAKGTAAQVLTMNAGATAPEWQTVATGRAPNAVLEDQKSAGTDGGTFNPSTWVKRTLNTEVYDPDGLISVASSEFTPTVNGWVEWSAPAREVYAHKTRLYNVTGAAVVGYGSSELSGDSTAGAGFHTRSFGGAPVSAGTTYRIEHYATTTRTTDGLGNALGIGTEVYTRLQFWRT